VNKELVTSEMFAPGVAGGAEGCCAEGGRLKISANGKERHEAFVLCTGYIHVVMALLVR
jgi:hypothetical protein